MDVVPVDCSTVKKTEEPHDSMSKFHCFTELIFSHLFLSSFKDSGTCNMDRLQGNEPLGTDT